MKNLILLSFLFLSVGISAQTFQHLVFDGQDDYVRYDNATDLIGAEFSMTGWFYSDDLSYGQGMMGLRDDAGGDGGFYMIQLNNGEIECRLQNTSGTLYEILLPAGTIKARTWQHYAFTYGNGKITMYLDGNPINQRSAFGNLMGATKPFVIGRSICCGINFYQDGKIDEVSLWSKALSDTEIQNIVDNEIDAESDNLELYYKFNQGIPGDNNTSVTKLVSETGNGDRDAEIIGFALQGTDSNFGGDIDVTSQIINFPLIANKLTTDAPFDVTVSSSVGLPVALAIVSGPAKVIGNTITLDGMAGRVVVSANQPGDGTFDPATKIIVGFDVVDPNANVANIDARSPYEGAVVSVPELGPIRIAAFSDIRYPELFTVDGMTATIGTDVVDIKNEDNGYFTGWWTPPAHGDYVMTLTAPNNYGVDGIETINFTVSADSENVNSAAVTDMWLDFGNQIGETDIKLPCYTAAYDNITADLRLTCPSGGCGEWDRVVNIEIQDETGRWIEFIRYITPYGTACSHQLDVTDFVSILHGKTKFRIKNGTFDNGYIFNLNLDYNAGTPAYKYSTVIELWEKIYPFGDMGDLQPTETLYAELPSNVTAAKMKLVSTGHGWGDNNTSNAAEFFRATHTIAVDDNRVFSQDNWETCNPNPDGCSPQAGTWTFPRAGWCPGAIAQWFDYDMAPYKDNGTLKLNYIFNENYRDLCHPNNPNCVTSTACDCDDGFNPELHVASSLVLFSDSPLNKTNITSSNKAQIAADHEINLFPNPASKIINVNILEDISVKRISIINILGQTVFHMNNNEPKAKLYTIDISNIVTGTYNMIIESEKGISTHMIIKE